MAGPIIFSLQFLIRTPSHAVALMSVESDCVMALDAHARCLLDTLGYKYVQMGMLSGIANQEEKKFSVPCLVQ